MGVIRGFFVQALISALLGLLSPFAASLNDWLGLPHSMAESEESDFLHSCWPIPE